MKTLKEYWEKSYDYYSGKVSELTRQFAFAGIAVIWVFRNPTNTKPLVPQELIWPMLFIFISLFCDFIHYAVSAEIWLRYLRHKEKKGAKADKPFAVPNWINYPGTCFYYAKIIAVGIAYIFIIDFLLRRL